MSTSRASIRQVADRAGVSRMTVSNVMNGRSGKVSPETLERVLSVVRELDYVPIPQPARQSRHVETRIIGLLFDEIEMEDIWGAEAYRGMRGSARELGYDLLTLLRLQKREHLKQDELRFLDRRSDGFIFLVPHERYQVLETLVENGIPAVTCFTGGAPPGVATVTLDNAGAMRIATEKFLELGHRNIAHLAGRDNRSDFRDRRLGYESVMETAGLEPVHVEMGGREHAAWLPELKALLKEKKITALACSNDNSALVALDALTEWGYRVPEDVSIIGMDDLAVTEARGLTSFHFSSEDVGRFAVEAAVGMMQGKSSEECTRVVPVELVERESVRAPRS